MRYIILFPIMVLSILLTACQKDEPATPGPPAPFGVETAYPLTGTVAGKAFQFYLQETGLWTLVCHGGYAHVWSTNYEINTNTDVEGFFLFKFEFPLDAGVYEAFRPGPLGTNFDSYYWNLNIAVPGDGPDGLTGYRASYRVEDGQLVDPRSGEAGAAPYVLTRSGIYSDKQGRPCFDVRLGFELPVARTGSAAEIAFLLRAEGVFRVVMEEGLN